MNNKIFKLLLAFVFLTSTFFISGCNNNDDYDHWKKETDMSSLLIKVGIPATYATSERAASVQKNVTLGGITLAFVENYNGLDYYSNYIPRNIVNNSLTALKLQIEHNVFYIDSNFFKVALSNVSKGSQPTALISFDQMFKVLSAEMNGSSVEIPSVWSENPDPEPTSSKNISLSRNGDTITAAVPKELGNVTSYYSWEIKFTPTNNSNSTTIHSGQYKDMYRLSQDGNNFYFTITENGKSNLEANTTYAATLESVVVYTDKYGVEPLSLTSDNTIMYNK